MPGDRMAMSLEVSVDYPDLCPEDIELLAEIADKYLTAATPTDVLDRLEDLQMRMVRMLLTACRGG